jgi:hypothetical protein
LPPEGVLRRLAFPLAGAALFLLAFGSAFWLTLPREAILGLLSPSLAKAGVRLEAEDARTLWLPPGIALENAALAFRPDRAEGIRVRRLSLRFDPLRLFWSLPFRARVEQGASAFLDLRLSGISASPARVRIEAGSISSSDFPGLLPGGSAFDIGIERCSASWARKGGLSSGNGKALLSRLRFPVPAPDSPVREAVLRDVAAEFTIHDGALRISSLRGKYEGSPVEGTGEILRISDPARSTITFHLKIPNPYDGNVAAVFDLVSKNAKSANLRVSGPLLSPAGEFQFF